MKNKLNLKSIHEANFRLLRDLARLCDRNGIRYFLDYGTLLGAVREGDFIPWDDDVDLVIMREEYERFLAACRRELGPAYQVSEYTNMNGYFWDYITRVNIIGSRLHRESREDIIYGNRQNHLGVDIFVLDKVPRNMMLCSVTVGMQKFLYLLSMGHRWRIDYHKYRPLERVTVRIVSGIGRYVPLEWIFRWQLKVCCMWGNCRNTVRMKSNALICELGFRFEEDWFERRTPVSIRGEQFSAPVEWDHVLHTIYGDYRKLPPVEKRHPEHVDETYWIDEKFLNGYSYRED